MSSILSFELKNRTKRRRMKIQRKREKRRRREGGLGEDHKKTLGTVGKLGIVYKKLKEYDKALEYYERALKGSEMMMGKTHPSTLGTVMNIAGVYLDGLKDYGKAEELIQRALEGKEAQLGKDHEDTKQCAMNLAICLADAGEKLKLRKILDEYPHILIEDPTFKNDL